MRGPDNLIFLKYAKEINRVWNKDVFRNIDEQLNFLERVEKTVFILEANKDDIPVQGSGFIVKDMGLFTNYHVIENNDFYTVKTYKEKTISTISTSLLYKCGSTDIDYALFDVKKNNDYAWQIGNSDDLTIGDKLTVIGFPNYAKGNSPDIQYAAFTGKRKWMMQPLYTIDKRIVDGASGGLVLNKKDKKVVGIIRCGAASLSETENNSNQGFIPINTVLKDIQN